MNASDDDLELIVFDLVGTIVLLAVCDITLAMINLEIEEITDPVGRMTYVNEECFDFKVDVSDRGKSSDFKDAGEENGRDEVAGGNDDKGNGNGDTFFDDDSDGEGNEDRNRE